MEMQYGNERELKILEEGEYCKIKYYIISYGTHPCAYVNLKRSLFNGRYNCFFGRDYDEINVSCHCGLTYANDHLGKVEEIIPSSGDNWVLGWDYAHDGDRIGNLQWRMKIWIQMK